MARRSQVFRPHAGCDRENANRLVPKPTISTSLVQMNIVEYKTVSAISSKELDYAVNRLLPSGYQPYGSPYVAGSGSSQSIFQALVKAEGVAGKNDASAAPAEVRPALVMPTPAA